MACMSSRRAIGVFVFLPLPLVLFCFVAFAMCFRSLCPSFLPVLFFALLRGYLSVCFLCGSCSFSYFVSYPLMLLQLLCCLAVQRHSVLFVRYIYRRFFALVRLLAQVFASWSRCLHSTRYAHWLVSSHGRFGVLVY